MIDLHTYKGARVLLTGHTGFKGRHLLARLEKLGALVFGYSLPEHDVRDVNALREVVLGVRPNFVFHLAAQAFVPVGYEQPLLTFETNAQGTVNLMEAARIADHHCAVVVVTTDKVYGEGVHNENSPLIGRCPYSASKVAAEHAVEAYRSAYFADGHIALATARAGNVLGADDQGVGRLLPNALQALRDGKPIKVNNPAAVRPWQHVDDVMEGYLLLGAALAGDGWRPKNPFAGAFNFGPSEHHTVQEVVSHVIEAWGHGEWVHKHTSLQREVAELRIVSMKARRMLGWRPKWSFPDMIRDVVKSYKERA